MVIKSTFKDYYDYVANQYGGGDPKIVYARTRLASPQEDSFFVETESIQLTSFRRWGYCGNPTERFAYLILAGKPYLLVRPASDLNDNINGYRVESPEISSTRNEHRWPYWRPNIEFGKENASLIKLSQKIGHPVFVVLDIEHGWRSKLTEAKISSQCPILQNIGMPSLIPATQMYQDLSYFVGNLMKASPDVKPPVELSNKQKIIKAGFDLVKSFRHRT